MPPPKQLFTHLLKHNKGKMTMKVAALSAVKRPISENPFYQMRDSLRMFNELQKVDDATVQKSAVNAYLNAAWKECSNDLIKRQLFMSILFSIGDITDREHNLFRRVKIKDVENGGYSKRRTFILCLQWMLDTVPEQFYRFLPIIGEYYNLDGTMLYELRTDRAKGTLKEVLKLNVDINRVTDYIATVLRAADDNTAFLWAKWLPHIPGTKRMRKYVITEKNIKAFQKGGHTDVKVGDTVKVSKDKKSHTKEKDQWVRNFIYILSKKMGWAVLERSGNVQYKGYSEFKKKYLAMTEAAMFSSKRVVELDKTQFLNWLDQLPSGARYNVQRRVLDKKDNKLVPNGRWKSKYGFDLGEAFIEWTKSKEVAQQTVRNLTKEQKEKMAPSEIKQLEKAAKVNTGADNILDLVANLLKNRTDLANTDIAAHQLLQKVQMLVPVLPIVDVSGSMSSVAYQKNGIAFTAQAMAQLCATLFLLKNPDENMTDMFIRFDDTAEVICSGSKAAKAANNRFMGTSSSIVPKLTDRTKKFSENLRNVSQYVIARGSTNFSSVAHALKAWVDAEPALSSARKEQINMYPVFLVVSDGDFNSSYTPASSLLDFQSKMRQWFGWEGVVVVWDVKSEDIRTNKFDNMDNVMYLGGCNIGILTQVFTKIHDVDFVDVYLPLKTLAQTARYAPVRGLTS